MGRVLEAIFRRPLQLLMLIAMLPVVSVAVIYIFMPRSYTSTASLWALQRYVVIGATGPESDLQATPAETQAAALSELLQSRAFALSVANSTDLASTLSDATRTNPQFRDDALYTEVSTTVQVVAQGTNLFTITYQNHNPYIAQQVVQSVVQQYGSQSIQLTLTEGKQLLDSYQTQLVQAKQQAAEATKAVTEYLATHPSLAQLILRTNVQNAVLTDSQYALLYSQAQQTQTNVANIQTSIATINQELAAQGTDSNSLFKVLDAPVVPDKSVSRTKTYLIGGGAGLGVALMACILYLLLVVRRDKSVYTPLDLHKVTELPVVLQLPNLNESARSLLIDPGLRSSGG